MAREASSREEGQPPVLISRVVPQEVGGSGEKKWSFTASVDPWIAECEARMVDGRLDITKLTIYLDPLPPSRNMLRDRPLTHRDERLTSDVLRRIPIGGILDAFRAHLLAEPDLEHIREQLRQIAGRGTAGARERSAKRAAATVRNAKRQRGRGRTLGDDHYRDVAMRRLALETECTGKGVNSTLAAHYGVSTETIRDWIARCRSLQFLAPGRQGQRSAYPGPRLLQGNERLGEGNTE